MLRAAFVRTAGRPDRIYVTRSDGSEVGWPFPTYGDGLPHDLVHLVVESAFGSKDGFWGRVDAGADPKVIGDQANRTGGRDKYAAYGEDRHELDLAEALVATVWAAVPLDPEQADAALRAECARIRVAPPPRLGPERIAAARLVLAGLARRWRALVPKGALDLHFDREDPEAGFEALRVAAQATRQI